MAESFQSVNSKQRHRKILGIALPLLLANVSQPLLGVVDTAILGHLDHSRYLVAVAIGTSLLGFLYWGFGFLRMGTSGASAQANGPDEINQTLYQALLLALLLGLSILALHPLVLGWAISVMNTPAESVALAQSYLSIRLLSAPAVLITFAAIGWLIGQQDSRLPLAAALLTNGLNIALDWLFIVHLNLYSDGAAWASVLSEYAGLLLIIVVLRRRFKHLPPLRTLFNARYTKLLNANQHIFLRTLLLLFSFAFFTAQGANMGPTVLAANAILMQLLMLMAYGLDGFANAAEALIGESVRRKQPTALLLVIKDCALWSAGIAAGFTLLLLGGQTFLLPLMTDLPKVLVNAHQYYGWLLALPLICVWGYLFDGIMIGALQTRWMLHTMLLSTAIYLCVWWLTLGMGNTGLWLAFLMFNLTRGLSQAAVLATIHRHNKWWC